MSLVDWEGKPCAMGMLGAVQTVGEFLKITSIVCHSYHVLPILDLAAPQKEVLDLNSNRAMFVSPNLSESLQCMWGRDETIVPNAKLVDRRVLTNALAPCTHSDLEFYQIALEETKGYFKQLKVSQMGVCDGMKFEKWTPLNNVAEGALFDLQIHLTPALLSLMTPMGACFKETGSGLWYPREMVQPEGINGRKVLSGGVSRLYDPNDPKDGLTATVIGTSSSNYTLVDHSYVAHPFNVKKRMDNTTSDEVELKSAIPAFTTEGYSEVPCRYVAQEVDFLIIQKVIPRFMRGVTMEKCKQDTLDFVVKDHKWRTQEEIGEMSFKRQSDVIDTFCAIFLYTTWLQFLNLKFEGLANETSWVRLYQHMVMYSRFRPVNEVLLRNKQGHVRFAHLTRLTKILFGAFADRLSLGFLDGLGRMAAVSSAVMNRLPTDQPLEIVDGVDAEAVLKKGICTNVTGDKCTVSLVFFVQSGENLAMTQQTVQSFGSYSRRLQLVSTSAKSMTIQECVYSFLDSADRRLFELVPIELRSTERKPADINASWLNIQRTLVAKELDVAKGSCKDLGKVIELYLTNSPPRPAVHAGEYRWHYDLVLEKESPTRKNNGKFLYDLRKGSTAGIGASFLINFLAQSAIALDATDSRAIQTTKNFVSLNSWKSKTGNQPKCLEWLPPDDRFATESFVVHFLSYGELVDFLNRMKTTYEEKFDTKYKMTAEKLAEQIVFKPLDGEQDVNLQMMYMEAQEEVMNRGDKTTRIVSAM